MKSPHILLLIMMIMSSSGVMGSFWSNIGISNHPPPTLPPTPPSTSSTCPGLRTFSSSPSDIYLSAVVDVHGGGICALVDPEGVQIMEAARWTTNKMNSINFIPGITIGITTYDSCGSIDGVLRAGISGVVEGGYLDDVTCIQPQPHVAFLTAAKHTKSLTPFLKATGVWWVEMGESVMTPQLTAVTHLLREFNWTSVAVVAPSIQVLKEFGHLAAKSRVCVNSETILPQQSTSANEYSSILESIGGDGDDMGVVAIGPQHHIHTLITHTHIHNYTNIHWIIVPTGQVHENVFQGLNSVARDLIAVRRASKSVPEFGAHFISVASSETTLYPQVSESDYVEDPAVLKMVEAVFKAGWRVREEVKERCSEGTWCPNASISTSDSTFSTGDIPGVFESLSITPEPEFYEILRLDLVDDNILAFNKMGEFKDDSLTLMEGSKRPPQLPCVACRCLNVRFSFLSDLRWRSESWVTICATMAIIGVILAVAIIVFISARCCRGRAPEGSQAFSLLLLLGCIMLYAAILPYSFEASTLTCGLRPFITGLAYAFVLAIMLSRSLMLATADKEGLVGHVSGVVQTALFFFMVTVQAGLGLQQWLMSSNPFISGPPKGGVIYACSGDPLHFLLSQTYVMFLLFLQLMVSPFTICSRRNYQEGLLFFLATVFISGIWVSWATLFMILPAVWNEACVCLGLAATATSILVTVFIPKTYLMVRAAARDSANFRPMSRPHSVHDLARASSMALYDSIGHIPEMQASSHPYAPDPTMRFPPHKENHYEAYTYFQPSPHKVTRF